MSDNKIPSTDSYVPYSSLRFNAENAPKTVFANVISLQASGGNFYLTFGFLDPLIEVGEGFDKSRPLLDDEASVAQITSRVVMPTEAAMSLVTRFFAGLSRSDIQATQSLLEQIQFIVNNEGKNADREH